MWNNFVDNTICRNCVLDGIFMSAEIDAIYALLRGTRLIIGREIEITLTRPQDRRSSEHCSMSVYTYIHTRRLRVISHESGFSARARFRALSRNGKPGKPRPTFFSVAAAAAAAACAAPVWKRVHGKGVCTFSSNNAPCESARARDVSAQYAPFLA